jgi:hypothetical protein
MGREASSGEEQLAVGEDLVAVVDVVEVQSEWPFMSGDADFGAIPSGAGKFLNGPGIGGADDGPRGVVESGTGPDGIVSDLATPWAVEGNEDLPICEGCVMILV